MNQDLVNSLNSLRVLSVDMISVANSGHPGIVLGAAPIIFSLYANHLRINPSDPKWPNRDRFVLSAGHASALLYATLFMAGYDISIDDLVNFRKLNSKCPGYPEVFKTPGVEVSTGASGQGLANAVGMAIASKYLSALVTEELPKQKLIDYYVYCLVSDSDLMEGVALEAAAIAGNLDLDNLIILYDSSDVTADGEIKKSSSDDVIRKFMSMGFEVDYVFEGNEVREIDKAIDRAKVNKKPTLIEIKTVIGRGSEHEGTNIVYGKPLTKDDIVNVRKKYNISTNTMEITENAVKFMRDSISSRMKGVYEAWKSKFASLKAQSSTGDNIKNLVSFIENGDIGISFDSKNFKIQNDYNEELRESNSKMMNIISQRTKFFIGGSADMAASCHSLLYKELDFSNTYRLGRNINFGVREHAMGAILNGLALSGMSVFGSTLLSYCDYVKPAIRMSAMMSLPVIYIFTHDSVIVGEDGPIYQPIEQLMSLRSIPNLLVFRPADINEVIGCWDYIINKRRTCAIVLSKDEAHILAGTNGEKAKSGAYVVKGERERVDCVLVSTGIDFTTTYLLSEELRARGIDLRLVSMPCMELFFETDLAYQREVIPEGVKVFTVEAGATLGWYKVASKGCAVGIDTFGASGKKDDVLEYLKFDYESILNFIVERL